MGEYVGAGGGAEEGDGGCVLVGSDFYYVGAGLWGSGMGRRKR